VINKKINFKTVLITGGTGGIGSEIIKLFYKNDYNILFTFSKNYKEAKKIRDLIIKNKKQCYFIKCDFQKESIISIKRKIHKLCKKTKKIDILINNAGYLNQLKFDKIDENEWDKNFQINLKSVFFITQELSKIFKKQKFGNILNIASIGGQIGGDLAIHYAASKAAIISLTKSYARLLSKYNVRVNCISPGIIKTRMVKKMLKKKNILNSYLIKRFGEPNDVAQLALFLASEDASFVTGQTYNVNGGSFFG
jgi:3-oxoacyl-[acyl-carrier protein] reductase